MIIKFENKSGDKTYLSMKGHLCCLHNFLFIPAFLYIQWVG